MVTVTSTDGAAQELRDGLAWTQICARNAVIPARGRGSPRGTACVSQGPYCVRVISTCSSSSCAALAVFDFLVFFFLGLVILLVQVWYLRVVTTVLPLR